MGEWYAGTVSDFEDGTRRLLSDGTIEISVLMVDGVIHALENRCLHQGGPVGEGVVVQNFEVMLGPDKSYQGVRSANGGHHLVCPWHGWEYQLESGACVADHRLKLRKYEVELRGNDVYVLI